MAEKRKNVAGMEIKSSSSALKNEKSQKALKDLKEKSAKNKKKVADKRKEADSAKKKKQAAAKAASAASIKEAAKKKEDLTGAAVAAGGALLSGLMKNKKSGKGGSKPKWGMIIIIAVIIIGALIFLGPKIGQLLSAFNAPGPSTLLPDEVMGYNSIDFQEAILGESREKQELVVMEQDVQIDSTISNALANIALFKKTKVIHSFGTGVYTIDMSKIDSDHIVVDETAKTVTVTVPHSILQYVNIDVNKTTFEETEHTIFKIGDIKLTQEQQNVLDQSIDEVLRAELNVQTLFDQADEIGVLKVQEIFQPLVSAVSEEFLVVVMQE
jgi:hypothetical protein